MIPDCLDQNTIVKLISSLESANICCGFPKKEYVDMANNRGGVFKTVDGNVRVYIQWSRRDRFMVALYGQQNVDW
jgi:hypothetical protein